jgi:excisionase family DNA binding protein
MVTNETTALLRVADVADLLGVSRMTVYRRIHDGSIPAIRLTEPLGVLRVPRDGLERWLYADSES